METSPTAEDAARPPAKPVGYTRWIVCFILFAAVVLSYKAAMAVMACVVLPVALAGFAPQMWIAVVLIGLACAGHQGFSTNLFTVPGDLFPHYASGTVAGLGGLAGACGGMLMAKFAGVILQTTHGDYAPIFMVSSVAYLLALIVVHLICPRWGRANIE